MTQHAIRERYGMSGTVHFVVFDHDLGRVVRDETVPNLITTAWLDRIRNAHMSYLDLTTRYVAWGSSTAAPAAGNTALTAEISRKQVTQRTSAGTGVLITTTYVAPGEGNAQLQEWGLFGGTTTGLVLVARVLWSHLKTSGESVQVDWQHTWSAI